MKTFLGVLASLIAIGAYIPYFRDIFRGRTKPHAFSWFIWFLLAAIAFSAQITEEGGAGAWAIGTMALISFGVWIAALKTGRRGAPVSDWIFFAGAVAALGVWAVTKDPIYTVLLISLIDVLAFVPTFRKSYHHPEQETAITYLLTALSYVIAVTALHSVSLTTVLYPLTLVISNSLFVILLAVRRKQLDKVRPPYRS